MLPCILSANANAFQYLLDNKFRKTICVRIGKSITLLTYLQNYPTSSDNDK